MAIFILEKSIASSVRELMDELINMSKSSSTSASSYQQVCCVLNISIFTS